MAVFPRRQPPPQISGNYVQFRPIVRAAFDGCCAYCLLPEIMAGGPENFELDHFRPKSNPLFATLINDFQNLYYCCHVCNHYKGAAWPSSALIARGYSFVDFCQSDFSEHFAESAAGHWQPLTLTGEYTLAKLRLNRLHLVTIRALLRRLARPQNQPLVNWNQPSRAQVLRLLSFTE